MRLKIEGIHTIGLYYSQCLFFKNKLEGRRYWKQKGPCAKSLGKTGK